MLIRLRSGEIFHSDDLRNAYYDGRGIVLGFMYEPIPPIIQKKLDFPSLDEEEATYILDEFWSALWNDEKFFDFEETIAEATDDEDDFDDEDEEKQIEILDDGANS